MGQVFLVIQYQGYWCKFSKYNSDQRKNTLSRWFAYFLGHNNVSLHCSFYKIWSDVTGGYIADKISGQLFFYINQRVNDLPSYTMLSGCPLSNNNISSVYNESIFHLLCIQEVVIHFIKVTIEQGQTVHKLQIATFWDIQGPHDKLTQ